MDDLSSITDSVFSKHSEFRRESSLLSSSGSWRNKGFSSGSGSAYSGNHPANQSAGGNSCGRGIEGEAGGSFGILRATGYIIRSLPLVNRLLPSVDPKDEQIQSLLAQQKAATNYRTWCSICLKLDALLNNNAWKLDAKLDLYDFELVRQNYDQLKQARLNKDYKLLLYLVRTTWIRNVGNMGNVNLYRHSYVGTKRLIEEYIQECELALEYLVTDDGVELDDRYLLGMLIQTRKNIGRTALVLLGGSTFGIFHIGVLATLLESNLLPRIVSGSSAGSIMASILCSCTNEETVSLLATISERKFLIFGDDDDEEEGASVGPGGGIRRHLKKLAHFLKYGTLFDISGLKQTMIGFVGELTFREAYNRTGKILNITVSPALIHEQTKLLNYLTAPNCLIWSAVCASCSLPGIFPSTSIYEKTSRGYIQEWNNDTSVKYVDGLVDNDLPITRLLEMFNVDHIIACQVNPHVVPFLKMSVTCVGGEIENEVSSKLKNYLTNIYDFMASEVIHYLEVLNEAGIGLNLSTKLISILSQQYSGDITILPDFNIKDFTKIFENPTPEFLLECIVRGARAAWPKVTVIKNHCGVEFALDKAITQLRGKIITSRKEAGNLKPSKNVGNSVTTSAGVAINSSTKANDDNKNKNKNNGNNNNYDMNNKNNLYQIPKKVNISSEFSLISSPVLNHDSSKSPSPNQLDNDFKLESNERRKIAKLRRHNTITAGTYRHFMEPQSKTEGRQEDKRHTISAGSSFLADHSLQQQQQEQQQTACFPSMNKVRGKSTTSLIGMNRANIMKTSPNKKEVFSIDRSPSPIFLHGRSKSFYSPEMDSETFHNSIDQNIYLNDVSVEGGIDLDSDNYYPEHFQDEDVGEESSLGINNDRFHRDESKMVRKAKSSGNFYSLQTGANDEHVSKTLKYEIERIPYYKGNPYLESPTSAHVQTSPSAFTTPSPLAVSSNPSSSSKNINTKANLPSKRVSGTNSLRSSYVGLNRLKDRSNNGSKHGSKHGSLGNLKELESDDSQKQKIMNLTSPDIRRTPYRGAHRALSRQGSDGVSLLFNKLAQEQQERDAIEKGKVDDSTLAEEREDTSKDSNSEENDVNSIEEEEETVVGDTEKFHTR